MAKLCFCAENRGFGSLPSSQPWDLMSHIIQSLQPMFNPFFPVNTHSPHTHPPASSTVVPMGAQHDQSLT